MDASIVIGILIGAVIVLAFLAFRKGGSGAGSGTKSTDSGPTIRRAEEPSSKMVDKRAVKAAAIEEREQLAAKRAPTKTRASVRNVSARKASTAKTSAKRAKAAKAPNPSDTGGKTAVRKQVHKRRPIERTASKGLPSKSGRKTSGKANRDVASKDAKNTKPRNMID